MGPDTITTMTTNKTNNENKSNNIDAQNGHVIVTMMTTKQKQRMQYNCLTKEGKKMLKGCKIRHNLRPENGTT